MQLTGKVAIVTGASRGIGRAIAVELGKLGATVVCNYIGSEEAIEETLALVKATGADGIAVKGDVSISEDVTNLVDTVAKEYGHIDILVNNAGITRDGLLMRMKEEDWDAVLDINLKGTFLTTKAVTRLMMKQKSGRVINITSVSGVTGNAGQANYAAAKAGLIGFTKSLAREVASRGITVNAVAPGFIATDMTDALNDEQKSAIMGQVPAGRLGDPKEIAAAVLFLASDEAAYVTGETLHVNGGMYMV